MKNIPTLFAALSLAACVGIADAGALVDISVIDRSSGQTLEVYRHQGRLYVAGTPGKRYVVLLRNKSAGRLLTVVSVDGINALSGQTAASSQSGYVLSPWQSAEIGGWRKSMDDVAAFYFTSLADSYAGRTDRPENVGVIGVAVYREATLAVTPPVSRQAREHERAAAPAASTAEAKTAATARDEVGGRLAESRLGTGHGERISAPTQYTDFRRATELPSEIVAIHYDSRTNLLAQGIIPRAKPQPPVANPFPGGFTPDPRG
ncbi:hypothetical protein [Accumulibacter sp.]|uniref:hypothetical protein n=1 Tax=Accumulibacter sp. TaxID=2053492 RepID=UPI002626F6AF|nr:hypothetical protein [Accumulibacter sp.]